VQGFVQIGTGSPELLQKNRFRTATIYVEAYAVSFRIEHEQLETAFVRQGEYGPYSDMDSGLLPKFNGVFLVEGYIVIKFS